MAAFTVIDHTELGAAATSWTKTSIPSSYDHLLLKFSTRSDSPSGERDEADVTLNGDTGTNYSLTQLWGGSATPGSQQTTGNSAIAKNYINGNTSTADTFGSGTLWIPHYANTANFKQVLIQAACEGATTTDYQWGLSLCAGLWSSTAAVNQITLAPLTGTNFVQYSTFTLYGVTGA